MDGTTFCNCLPIPTYCIFTATRRAPTRAAALKVTLLTPDVEEHPVQEGAATLFTVGTLTLFLLRAVLAAFMDVVSEVGDIPAAAELAAAELAAGMVAVKVIVAVLRRAAEELTEQPDTQALVLPAV